MNDMYVMEAIRKKQYELVIDKKVVLVTKYKKDISKYLLDKTKTKYIVDDAKPFASKSLKNFYHLKEVDDATYDEIINNKGGQNGNP
jgi:uncharacterized protein YaaR (DUF327 family)